MKKILLLFSFIFLIAANSNSQTLKPGFGGTGFQSVQSDVWGNDVVIYSEAPVGQMSGVARPNGEIFVAVPDTTPGFSLRIWQSTNFGETWTINPTGITPGGAVIPKTKMLRSGLDSIYCTFVYADTVYIWNIESNNFGVFTTVPVRDYDMCAASDGGLFMYVDELGDNDVRRYGSGDGGVTWPATGFVTSNGAFPTVEMSNSGDTLLITYYGPVLADTSTSILRTTRYRVTGLGTFTTVSGAFADIVTSSAHKPQAKQIGYNGTLWYFWTEGDPPNQMVKCRVSTNFGSTYGTEFVVAGGSADNFWFDAEIYEFGSGGADFINLFDSVDAKINYRSTGIASPEGFGAPVGISENEPVFLPGQSRLPQIIEFYDAGGDVGAMWVGVGSGPEGANLDLFYDRLSAVSNIQNGNEIAETYELNQNYPNPFNPSTKISFSIPKDGFTTLKVYDAIGREIATLLSRDLQGGSYEVDFNGSKFSSGVYFYRLVSNDFSSVKKMILTK